MIVVLMGVTGAGKTTIGLVLAARIGWRFVDADELHSPENKAKMHAGLPLDDDDRRPWLQAIGRVIDSSLARDEGLVLACSALKERYRALLCRDPARVRFVWLDGPPELIAARLARRTEHFASPALLPSQLAALEPPADALRVDVRGTPDEVAARIDGALGLSARGRADDRTQPA